MLAREAREKRCCFVEFRVQRGVKRERVCVMRNLPAQQRGRAATAELSCCGKATGSSL